MPQTKDAAHAPIALRDACIVAAREAIAEHGIEQLSLRDVARRLGVSHQAPYKHYPSRDHLLAEVMRRCFEGFAALSTRAGSSTTPGTIWAHWVGNTSITRTAIRWNTG
jgi:AcrR family transcriptional regulator